MITFINHILFLLFFFAPLIGAQPNVYLIVACHGNMDLTPHLSWENFKRFYYDDIIGSAYERNVQLLRNDPFFCLHHPMQTLGLHPIQCTLQRGHTAGLFGVVHHALSADEGLYRYYTFGWSGLQSPSARLSEAKLLYECLKKEFLAYKAQGYNPHITLLGYSHGGNVALNAGAYYDDHWHIDRLILLGVPIVPESSLYAASKLFKKIYNFYSMADRVQPLDCLGEGRIFSERFLRNVSSNVHDVQISVKRLSNGWRFNNAPLDHPLQRALKKNDPSHVEWWSFGWTAGYRNSFALYPLPISVFTPLFIDALEKSCSRCQHSKIDIHPYNNIFYVHDQHDGVKAFNFVDTDQLTTFKKYAQCVEPIAYSGTLFKAHVNKILYPDEALAR